MLKVSIGTARLAAQIFAVLIIGAGAIAADKPAENKSNDAPKYPLVLDENFSHGADRWKPASAEGWKIIDLDGGKAFSRFKIVDITKKLPHRSPWNIAMLKDINVGDFVLEVKLRETAPRTSCIAIVAGVWLSESRALLLRTFFPGEERSARRPGVHRQRCRSADDYRQRSPVARH